MNYLYLLINGDQTDEYFCHLHQKWNWSGDECNCCIMAEEDNNPEEGCVYAEQSNP